MINQESPQLGTSSDDFTIGHYDFNGGGFSNSLVSGANAVRVKLTRQSSLNGELPLFFGSITGQNSLSLQQHAVAAMLNNIKGFYQPANNMETIDILPIALDLETWLNVLAGRTSDTLNLAPEKYPAGATAITNATYTPKVPDRQVIAVPLISVGKTTAPLIFLGKCYMVSREAILSPSESHLRLISMVS